MKHRTKNNSGTPNISGEQRPPVSTDRDSKGRFRKGNSHRYSKGQSGNVKGRPRSVRARLARLQRVSDDPNLRYVGQLLNKTYRKHPRKKIELKEALRLLAETLKEAGAQGSESK